MERQMQRVWFALDFLIQERNGLETKLNYAQSTIFALQRQTRELESLLTEAQDELLKKTEQLNELHPNAKPTDSNSILTSKTSTGTDWIGGSWLVVLTNHTLLGAVETAWQEGKTQEALNLLTAVSNRDDLDPAEGIEVGLLFSAIHRSAGLPERALDYVEESLQIAENYGLLGAVGKIQFHRGLSLLHLRCFADAAWCFVLASGAEGHGQEAEVNWEIAERQRVEMDSAAGISRVL